MKKRLIVILAGLMVLGCSACGNTNTAENIDAADTTVAVNDAEENADNGASAVAESPVELLSSIWATYSEDEMFPCAGGDYSEENQTMDGPGKYGLEDAEAIDNVLAIPASALPNVDDAASLVHMMNLNTFTCGAFHLSDASKAESVAADIKANISAREWVCGMPDKMVIVTAGDYVVSFYGEAELVNTFKKHLTEGLPSAVIFAEEDIVL